MTMDQLEDKALDQLRRKWKFPKGERADRAIRGTTEYALVLFRLQLKNLGGEIKNAFLAGFKKGKK